MNGQQSSQEDRTEEATPRRLAEARREGQIPKTEELSSAASLLVAGLMIGPGTALIGSTIGRITTTSLGSGPMALETPAAAVEWIRWTTMEAALAFLPFGGALALAALAVGVAQGRGTLTAKPLTPQLKRLSPLERLKRYVGPQPWMDLLKALTKLVIVGAVAFGALSGASADLSRLAQTGPGDLVSVLRNETARLLLASGLALLALAALDYAFQVWQDGRRLRMTKEEIKRESKESEGDPLIRARLRALGRSLSRLRMMSDVPTADVVVTNPTHIAVALRYDPQRADAPVVVAMGQRKLAQRIKRIALENGVPVVENKPVARALFGLGRIGEPIPQALYVAVAQILAFVLRHRAAHAAGVEARA